MVYFATHTPEASLLYFLEPYDRALFSGLEKYVDSSAWVQAGYSNCRKYNDEDVRSPFPYLLILGSLVSCFLLYLLSNLVSPMFQAYRNLKPSDKEKWNVKLVSAFHAAFVFQGALRSILLGGGLIFNSTPIDDGLEGLEKHVCAYATDLSRFYMAITFGYMFYDFWVCIRAYGFTLEGIFPSLVIHHFNIITSFFLSLKFGMGHYSSLCFMTNEISQPFLHLSWLLIKSKVPQMHPISVLNGICMVLTFLGSRLFFNLIIFTHFMLNTPSYDPRPAVGMGTWTCITHVACNCYWCYLMIVQIKNVVSAKLSKKGEKPASEKKDE